MGYVYYCTKCNNLEINDDPEGQYKCSACGEPLLSLHKTAEEWNDLSNEEMIYVIETGKRVRIRKPVFDENIENATSQNKITDLQALQQSDGLELSERVGKYNWREIKRQKSLFIYLCSVITLIVIFVIAMIAMNGISSDFKNNTKDVNNRLFTLEYGPYEYVTYLDFQLLHMHARDLKDEYNNLSEKKRAKYENWIMREYGVSYASLISRVKDYGIDIDKVIYNRDEAQVLVDAYRTCGFSAPYSNGQAVGNVPDLGANRYTEAEIDQIAVGCGLRKKTDDYEGINAYYSDRLPVQISKYPPIYLSIMNKGDSYGLVCSVTYRGSNWLFFDKITVKINDSIVDFPVPKEPKRDTVSGGNVKEYYSMDVYPGDALYNLLKQLSSQPGTEIKFIGEKSKVMELDENDCLAIKDVIDAYDIVRAGKKEN